MQVHKVKRDGEITIGTQEKFRIMRDRRLHANKFEEQDEMDEFLREIQKKLSKLTPIRVRKFKQNNSIEEIENFIGGLSHTKARDPDTFTKNSTIPSKTR